MLTKWTRMFWPTWLICLAVVGVAAAHPVSQGAMEVTVSPAEIKVRARVTDAEILVAATFGGGAVVSGSEADMRRRHGDYLLKHLRVEADGRALTGVVEAAPEALAAAEGNLVEFRLRFPLAEGVAPKRLTLAQDMLNEFEFAPGNRWEATYLVRLSGPAGVIDEGRLLTSTAPVGYELNVGKAAVFAGRARLAGEYLLHGVHHILVGYDHLLFITALVLAAATFVDLVKVLSAFTLAHTVTLTLSVLDVVRLSERIVEPMIAASIVFVAVQNVLRPAASRGRGRLALAFFFGLFHGLGFAGGLLDAMQGMSGLGVGLAIAAFSVGVEAGHLMVVLPVFFGLRAARTRRKDEAEKADFARRALRGGSAFIAVAGGFYLVAALRAAL